MPCDVTTTTTTTTTTTPAPAYVELCPSDYSTGPPFPIDQGITGTGFIVDIEVRINDNLNNVFYAAYPAAPGDSLYCDLQPVITVQTGQTIVFKQEHISNGGDGYVGEDNPLYIATSLEGSPGSYAYVQGVEYRMGLTGAEITGTYDPGCDECAGCANIVWDVALCAPSILYYRSYVNNNMGGTIVVEEGPTGCSEGVTGCSVRTRPFDEILPLVLSDSFYEWYEATNEIISAINPIKTYDVNLRGGLREKFNQGGEVHIEVDAGDGLRVWPPDPVTGSELTTECWDGKIRLDFFGLPEIAPTGSFEPFEDTATGPCIEDNDLFAIERVSPYQGVFPNDIAGEFYKVKAENMLPPTVHGNHRFTGLVVFENPVTDISSTKVVVDDKNIELGHSPYLEMVVELVTGPDLDLSSLSGNTGSSHDPDGDGIYYNDGGVTGEIWSQLQEFFDSGVSDLLEITGSETAKATLLSIGAITGSPAQVTVILRSYNDIIFDPIGSNITTERSGYTLKIVSIAGQAGTDVDADGGGITLVSRDSTGNKTILWEDDTNAWEINQNFKIDDSHALLTPLNIAHQDEGNVNSITGDSHWNVDHYITGSIHSALPLPVSCPSCNVLTDDDWGLLHFAYSTGSDDTASLSLLPCGGIYIHNISCSPQFSGESGPCNVVVGNQYGLIDGSWTDRMFYETADTFAVGDVVTVIDSEDNITGAQADSADNAEVLGIVVELISAGEEECGTKKQGVVVAYAGEMDWLVGYAGLSALVPGHIYYLSPDNQGELTAIEPLDVGEVRKPMILAIEDDRVLIVNYEGVINGDYFDENPVTQLTELRDVTITSQAGGDVLYYDGPSGEWVNEPIHVALGSMVAKSFITGSVTGGDTASPGLSEITLTFSGAYPYASLPPNQMSVFRGTFAAYDYAITGTSGADTGITGNIPSHEMGGFGGAFFNMDDVTGGMTGAVTGSLGMGVANPATSGGGLPYINWGEMGKDKDFYIDARYSEIDFDTGDITLTLNVTNEGDTIREYGLTAWLEFLGTDVLDATT